MPKITPFLQEVVYIVADFLASIQHTKEAEKLKKQFELPAWVEKDNPLIKKGLKKVLRQFINENEKVLKYFKNRKPEQEEEQVESQSQQQAPKPTKKQRKSVSPKQSPLTKPKSPKPSTVVSQITRPKGWMASQFQQPKRLEDLNEDTDQVPKKQQPEVVIPKKDKKSKVVAKVESSQQSSQSQQQTRKKIKQKKQIKKEKKQKKVKGPVDSSYLNSEQQFQLQGKKAKTAITPQKKVQKVITRKQSAQVQEPKVEVTSYVRPTYINNNNNQPNGQKQFFSRINKNEVGPIPENRRNNTFEAKAQYGVGDAWGQYGHQKLINTRGESFKKTKGKLKNRAFQGSGINIDQVNSVPIFF